MSAFLSPDELEQFTRRQRPSGQRRVLDALGVPYRAHPFDGSLLVASAAVERCLGVLEVVPANEAFVVDVEALAQHGKKANRRGP